MSEKVVTPEMIKKAGDLLKAEHAERMRLEKVASDLQLEKRAQKLAYREVELGITEPYKSHAEFQEKVAGLLTEDLDVLEKAIERGYAGSRSVGELDGGSPAPRKGSDDPLTHFIRTGELET